MENIINFIMLYKTYFIIYFVIGFINMLYNYGKTVRRLTMFPHLYRGQKVSWRKLIINRFIFWPLFIIIDIVTKIAMIGVK